MTNEVEADETILVRVNAVSGSPTANVTVEPPTRIEDVEAQTQAARPTRPDDSMVSDLTVRVEELGQQWARMVEALRNMFQLSEAQVGAFRVDTVKVACTPTESSAWLGLSVRARRSR